MCDQQACARHVILACRCPEQNIPARPFVCVRLTSLCVFGFGGCECNLSTLPRLTHIPNIMYTVCQEQSEAMFAFTGSRASFGIACHLSPKMPKDADVPIRHMPGYDVILHSRSALKRVCMG